MRPKFIAPELATLVETPFSEKGWIFEEKFDGIRSIVVKVKGKVTLYSRNHKTLNRDFPSLVKALSKRGKDFVADGEIVAFEGKVTSFSKLQNRGREKMKIYLYLFDLLVWDGEDLRKLPLIERKKRLKQHFSFGEPVRYTPHIQTQGVNFFKKAEKKGWEGIIGKRADSLYKSRRTRDWLKFKCTHSQEFVIGGFTEPRRSRVGFGALLIGYYKKGKLFYAGKVGTGYNTSFLKTLTPRLKKMERGSSPFSNPVKEKGAHFLRPTLVCEIGFTEWTTEGKLRHPAFLGLRKDKPAKSVRRE